MVDEHSKLIELKKKSDRKKHRVNDAMNKAYFEDESIRQASQQRSAEYLNRNERDERIIPWWLWFVTGVLFVVFIENVILNTPIVDWIGKYFY